MSVHAGLMSGFRSLTLLHQLSGRISRTLRRLDSARAREPPDSRAVETLRMEAEAHEVALEIWLDGLPQHLKSGKHTPGSPLAIQSCVASSSVSRNEWKVTLTPNPTFEREVP